MLASVSLLALYILTAGVMLLLGVFCLEVLLAVLPWPETTRVEPLSRFRFAVLIPAHNQQAAIGRTLKTLVPTLGPNDRVLVVADNCTDNTAYVARHAGAEVIERHDLSKRGKGYAIDFGLKHFQTEPPDAVVFLDADCEVQRDTVQLLGTAAVTMRRPAQAMHLSDPDPEGEQMEAVADLAYRFKNVVRAIGLFRMTGLCYLSGTGMALPWALTYNLRDSNESFVENKQLGLDLSVAGQPPLLVPNARVDTPFSQETEQARAPRSSSPGHLKTLLTLVPQLLLQGTLRGRPDVLGLALDLAIPPISYLAGVWVITFAAALVGIPLGATAWPALFLVFGAGGLILAVLAGWFFHCRKSIRFATLCAAPFYAMSLHHLPGSGQQGWATAEAGPATSANVARARRA